MKGQSLQVHTVASSCRGLPYYKEWNTVLEKVIMAAQKEELLIDRFHNASILLCNLIGHHIDW